MRAGNGGRISGSGKGQFLRGTPVKPTHVPRANDSDNALRPEFAGGVDRHDRSQASLSALSRRPMTSRRAAIRGVDMMVGGDALGGPIQTHASRGWVRGMARALGRA